MSSFWWAVDNKPIEIIFSLCRNGRWMEYEGKRVGVRFHYLEHNDVDQWGIDIGLSELEDLGENVANMLLQVLNLETT